MISETERLILHGIKHIIERETWTPEIRKDLDKDICNKIVDFVSPRESEKEPCCEMPKEFKYFNSNCPKCQGRTTHVQKDKFLICLICENKQDFANSGVDEK